MRTQLYRAWAFLRIGLLVRNSLGKCRHLCVTASKGGVLTNCQPPVHSAPHPPPHPPIRSPVGPVGTPARQFGRPLAISPAARQSPSSAACLLAGPSVQPFASPAVRQSGCPLARQPDRSLARQPDRHACSQVLPSFGPTTHQPVRPAVRPSVLPSVGPPIQSPANPVSRPLRRQPAHPSAHLSGCAISIDGLSATDSGLRHSHLSDRLADVARRLRWAQGFTVPTFP